MTKTQIPAVSNMDYKYSDCKQEMGTEPAAEEAEPERGNWTGRFDFLLSLLGYSVGLGNVWRFPYLCYNNGGGAFLIPFTVMLIIAGLPLMFMELSFGQYAALGPVAVYNKFCPLFQGLGYGMVIVSCVVMLYYNLIIAWTIYYMAVSFISIFYQLPWSNCDADWSTIHCYSYEEADACEAENGTYYLRKCLNQTYVMENNIVALAEKALRRPPAEEYFTNQVLGLSSGIEETGYIRPGMAACLLAAWVIVFLCLCKGVQSSGKVVYFTALFPYVVLVILFFRGITLPGASTGILYYLTPDFSRLISAQVWGDAAVQIFFALSPAWGGLITLSSYNKFSNNCYVDSLIVAVSNILTSFFAGLVIFSVIGFLAHELDVEVDKVVDQGAGLAFIVYPEVVTRLPISPLWSILFFVMLLTLGLDSQFALMETVTTAIMDRFPKFRQKKVWVVMSVAVLGYFGGLIFTTNSGMYWLQLMDKYAANWSVLIIAIGECILIAWIYGAEKFCVDIQRMIGKQSKLWVFFWSSMWRVITPSALVFILVFNWIEYKPASYGHYLYPMWADAVGWTLGMLPVMVVVLMAIDQICSGPDDLTIMEASQDGGDSTSITSGVDNEMKKSGGGISKTKKTSIKRKVQNFSLESDDGVVEPLLQKEKEKETGSQSAKFSLSRTKTDSMTEKDEEKDKLLDDNKTSVPSMTPVPGITNNLTYANGVKDSQITKSYASAAPIHNHMNTNVFASRNEVSSFTAPKTQILVDIDGNKQKAHSPSPLIFTTAKIHTDGKTKTLEPVHVTPQPILSTVEGNIVKVKTCTDEQRLKNDFGSAKKDYHLGFEALESKSDVSHPCAPNESSPNTVATVSVSFYSGILNKGPTVTSASTICTPFVPTELKTFKYIPSEGKVKDITANKMTTANTKDNTEIKQNAVNNASLSQTNHYAKPEATKTSSTVKDLKNPSSTTIKSGETNNLSQFKLQHASAPIAVSEVEIDINKNIQAANVSTPRKYETSISPSIVGEITKDSCNKQLQRQKDAIVEDDKMTDKYSRSERDKPNDSRIRSVSAKSNIDTAKEVEDPSKKVTSPQTCANNVVKDSSKITTAPSTINKGVVVDTITSTFVPKPSVKTTDTNNCPTSSTLKTGVTKSSTQSTSLSTAEDMKVITSNHSKIPTSTTPVTNAKTTSSFTQPLSSLTGTSNISKTSVNGTTKTKEESKPMANVPKATSANSPTPTPNSNQTASNTPQVSSLTSNKSKTPMNVAMSTENSTFPQTVSTTTTSSSSKTSTSSAVKITPTTRPSKTVSHIPLTTSSPSALKQTTTTAATSSLLSNKPSPVPTSEACKTSTALTPNKSSETPSLSQSTKVKPSVSTVVNSTPNSSAVKTMTPATTSVASKPSTVTTMKTSTSKLSSIPKTTTKSVNATAESTSSTIKPPANSKVSINQSRNDKSKP